MGPKSSSAWLNDCHESLQPFSDLHYLGARDTVRNTRRGPKAEYRRAAYLPIASR